MTFRWIVQTAHGEVRRFVYLTSALEFAARRAVMAAPRAVTVTEAESWAAFQIEWRDGAGVIGGKFTDVQRRAAMAAFDLFTALMPGGG